MARRRLGANCWMASCLLRVPAPWQVPAFASTNASTSTSMTWISAARPAGADCPCIQATPASQFGMAMACAPDASATPTAKPAHTPVDALAVIEGEQLLDLLVVDYAMPGMNGATVIDRARASRQKLKVILMSGHSDVLRSSGISGVPLLAKPFKAAELRQRISEVLWARSPDDSFGSTETPHLAVSH